MLKKGALDPVLTLHLCLPYQVVRTHPIHPELVSGTFTCLDLRVIKAVEYTQPAICLNFILKQAQASAGKVREAVLFFTVEYVTGRELSC